MHLQQRQFHNLTKVTDYSCKTSPVHFSVQISVSANGKLAIRVSSNKDNSQKCINKIDQKYTHGHVVVAAVFKYSQTCLQRHPWCH